MKSTITLTVNGKTQVIATEPKRTLRDVLREELGLTSTKYGCGEGRCGSCTVLLDGMRVHACQVVVANADGKAITTIEGLAQEHVLHPVQEAFLAEDAMQCGYCTPGMILATVALLEKNPHPNDKEILDWMNGNLCRCNGYPKILRAVRRAAGAT